MTDPRFFNKKQSYSLKQIIEIANCQQLSEDDGNVIIDDVSSLDKAKHNHLSFFDNIKYKDNFKSTKSGACFVSPEMSEFAPKGLIPLITDTPYKSYALAAQAFYPDEKPQSSISEYAYIDPTSEIGSGANIGVGVVIEGNVEIGNNVWIESGAVIKKNVIIGDNCRIGSNASISHSIIGDYVRLYPGVCVGQDGFGFAIDSAGHVKVPQLGRVIIEDHVEIGANTTIDRGSGPDTIIGQGTWIDNLVQIAHNVVIGKGCVIVAQVGISGSTVLEDYVVIGGQVGIAGHLRISTGVRIGAQAGVISDLSEAGEYIGSPAFPKSQFFRQVAALNRLIKKKKSV